MAGQNSDKADTLAADYAALYAAASGALPGQEAGWLRARREAAMARFAETRFPRAKDEAWRYTPLARLKAAAFPPLSAPQAAAKPAGDGAIRLTFSSGWLNLPGPYRPTAGLTIRSLAEALRNDPAKVERYMVGAEDAVDGTELLNRAFLNDGYVIEVEAGADISLPVEVAHETITKGRAAQHLSHFVVLGERASASIVERHAGDGEYWTNSTGLFRLGAGARLRHFIHQDDGPEAIHTAKRRVSLAAEAAYEAFALSSGAALARDELNLDLNGAGARADVGGIFLAGAEQARDTIVVAEHNAADTASNQTFRGILKGRARAAFQGRVVVAPGADGTDAHQTCNNLILERGAEADAKPELLIAADEVSCSHGTTVGEIDEDALFYLMARGLDPTAARGALIEAFAAETIEGISEVAVREAYLEAVRAWTANRMAEGKAA